MLIHFDETFLRDAEREEAAAHGEAIDRKANLMDWYIRWARGCVGGLLLVLPENMRGHWEARAQAISNHNVLWYGEDGNLSFPTGLGHVGLWLVNGRLFPIVNWDAADGAVGRHQCEVLVFGPPGSVSSSQYPESLIVDESGRVLKVERHYFDSPAFTDVAYGPISFCYVSGKKHQELCTHLLQCGWGLDSIRKLSESAAVEWCAAPSVLSSMAGAEWRKNHGERAIGDGGAEQIRSAGTTTVLEIEPSPADRPSGTMRSTSTRNSIGSPVNLDDVRGGQGDRASRNGNTDAGAAAWGTPNLSQAYFDIPRHGFYPYVKRCMDVVFSLLALTVTLPLFIMVAILVKLTSPGPVFYADRRQGRGGAEFRCYKFRTMVANAAEKQAELRKLNEVDGPQFKMTDDPRLTNIGRWLRKYNVDELPQFINVLLGQMSLVGPRPSPDRENQLCPGWRRTRLSLRPGITGLWQVLRLRDFGPSDFQEWIYYDLEYARHQSFWLDCLIIAYTPFTVCKTHRLANLAKKLAKRGICVEADVMHQRRGEQS